MTSVAAAICLALEFAHLLPRPGILAKVGYSFDWLDAAATLVSICTAYGAARVLAARRMNVNDGT